MADIHFSSATAVLAEKGKSFYWARHFLGMSHAQRATRLYRLCRYVDDMADESVSKLAAEASLTQIKDSLRAGTSNDPVIVDGIQLLRECNIDASIFLELVAGVESDLQLVRIADMNALLHYSYQVAGTVGLMMCKILDTEDQSAFAHAVDLGIAMQLTNICRDVAADAALGRRYLPASMVGDLSPSDILNPTASTQKLIQNCMKDLLACADRYYRSGERGLAYLPLGARAGILLSSRLYKAIGNELKRKEFIFWQGRAIVSTRRKTILSLLALLELPLRPMYWLLPREHDDTLHAPLLQSRPHTLSFFNKYAL